MHNSLGDDLDVQWFEVLNSTVLESDNFSRVHPILTSIFVTSAGLSGFIVNAYILYRILFHNVFGRLFGWMWMAREAALLCSNFLDWGIYGPSLALFPLSTKAMLLLFHPALITRMQTAAADLLIASNRCLLIRKPLKFKTIFTPRRTASMVGISWTVPVIIVVGLHSIPRCPGIKIDGGALITFCVLLETFAAFLFLYVVLIATLIVDIVAIVKLYEMNKVRKHVLCNHLSPNNRRKQLNFCYMIILQILVVVPTTFLQLFYDSLLFDISDTLDGLIVICFNDDLRPWKSRRQKEMERISSGENIAKSVPIVVK
ncbi:hypothetical protein QR680_007170 [Steinernema hermaphroditum]|uniref:7TM GPCR serpentine receptor class x (Srx) domain-containing protein n=1 Tax=Steinernema hermaphroditum TaxID=289476 RepID=A0AA39I059_9BILA|nr:hypothetical protein QR680_007170 [Steinernema hermaphroditum]